ncbi:hypothetical protein ACSBQ0_04015 [Bacillus altitudinis]|uniref:Na+-transporting methylmalonyl-CoA/oxaloacetate decarboxylase gamma subunit n=1 Tax=Bacillus aerius TaxID=293388 RepID=A0ABR6B334_9BACI|nr:MULTISPECIES: hypothetical protein [Bacillus]MBA8918520.1 Na+-transporting methylmalonyl-CoA/oxaloacetate decarboxylase gamma subunit [Bacillus aerius]MDI6647698.1 hypothetical protein [Bacillus altitudinis]MDI6662321.1 hypothetical protein [Bacillus altitudinis]
MSGKQEGKRFQRFPELDTIIDMVNWWMLWINLYSSYIIFLKREWGIMVLDKKIGIGHLVYTSIIALLVITFILVFSFGGNKDAGNQVNVMATGISIILAVIAILMTLVDVAGQRQSIIDMKEAAEKLKKSQQFSQENITELLKAVKELDELKLVVTNTANDYKNYTHQIINDFVSNQQGIPKEQVDEIIEKVNAEFSKFDNKVKDYNSIEQQLNLERRTILRLKKFVKTFFKGDSIIESYAFHKRLKEYFNHSEQEYVKNYLQNRAAEYINPENGIMIIDTKAILGRTPE